MKKNKLNILSINELQVIAGGRGECHCYSNNGGIITKAKSSYECGVSCCVGQQWRYYKYLMEDSVPCITMRRILNPNPRGVCISGESGCLHSPPIRV